MDLQCEIIKTPRLLLRKITPETYKYAFDNLSQSVIMEFFGLTSDSDFIKEKEKYQKGITTYNRSFLNFQIIDPETNSIIGACGYHTWYFEHARAEIGYALNDDSYKGKGIMTEALKAVIEYGFQKMNLHRIEAFIGPKNEASLRLVQNLNFTKEGQLRQHYFKNNVMEDSVIFSLLKHEYLH